MKDSTEKKTITTTFKVSQKLNDEIEAAAKNKGISKSQYITECIKHRENSLTPEILCRIENILGKCRRIAEEDDLYTLNNIAKEIDELWDFLK